MGCLGPEQKMPGWLLLEFTGGQGLGKWPSHWGRIRSLGVTLVHLPPPHHPGCLVAGSMVMGSQRGPPSSAPQASCKFSSSGSLPALHSFPEVLALQLAGSLSTPCRFPWRWGLLSLPWASCFSQLLASASLVWVWESQTWAWVFLLFPSSGLRPGSFRGGYQELAIFSLEPQDE